MAAGKFGDAALKFLQGGGVREVHFIDGGPGEVQVGILKSGEHESTVKVNHRGVGGGQSANLTIGAESEQLITAYGQGLGAGPGAVPGPDVAIEKNAVGMGRGRQRQREQGEEKQNGCFSSHVTGLRKRQSFPARAISRTEWHLI